MNKGKNMQMSGHGYTQLQLKENNEKMCIEFFFVLEQLAATWA